MTPAETEALEVAEELMRPVRYRGTDFRGEHRFSEDSTEVTHVFPTIEEARQHFAGRVIRDLPAAAETTNKHDHERT